MADDCIHGHSFWPGATIFPTQLAMACTWDPDLLERGARATAVEVCGDRAALDLLTRAVHRPRPAVGPRRRNLRRRPAPDRRTRRRDDPRLPGRRARPTRTAVLATAKHFAGYSETQGGRDASEADLSPRKLRSWFLPPFERAVDAGCRTFMLGYQAIDGVPITANKWLLNDVLKGEWGFTGTLVTDWDNVGRMVWEQTGLRRRRRSRRRSPSKPATTSS